MSSAFRLAPVVVLLTAGSALAGIETVPVTFSISGTADLFDGAFTFESDFDATYDGTVLSFDDAAGSFGSNGSYDFSYTDLSAILDGEFIDSTFGLLAADLGGDVTANVMLSGFGSEWDGTSASGTGLIVLSDIGFFTPESVDITWSINQVPTPGALALLGVAGLARRRRRG